MATNQAWAPAIMNAKHESTPTGSTGEGSRQEAASVSFEAYAGDLLPAGYRIGDPGAHKQVSWIQHRLHEQLQRVEERLRLVTQSAGIGTWDYFVRQDFLAWDPLMFEIYGVDPGRFGSRLASWEACLHPGDARGVKQALDDSLQSGGAYEQQFRILTPAGECRHVESHGVVYREENGAAVRLTGISRNVTERVEALKQLKDSEARHRTLFQAMRQGVVYQDAAGRIILANPAAEHILGISFDEMQRRSSGESEWPVIRDDGSPFPTAEHPTMIALRTGRPVNNVMMGVYLPGAEEPRWINIHAVPIFRAGEDRPSQAYALFDDVTEAKSARRELERFQKLESLGTLAGGIAHDFNNILMGIFGNLAMAREVLPADSPARGFLEDAEKSMDRATGLTRQLLTFAKGGAPVREELDLHPLVEEIASFDLSGSSIKAHFQVADGLWAVEADKGQMQQVFSNLVINAKQAMPSGGHLTIALDNRALSEQNPFSLPPGDYVRAAVIDEGVGIPESILERIFDPYFTTKSAGSGLGLALSYSIIHRHGGFIGAANRRQGGAVFQVLLPALSRTNNRRNDAVRRSYHQSLREGGRVLVLDDEHIVHRVVKAMLGRCGYHASAAYDGREAVNAYRQAMDAGAPYNLVLMDLTIPGGMGGLEAMREIARLDPDAACIVSSGHADNPALSFPGKYGFRGKALKPYTLETLEDLLRRHARHDT